MPATTEFLRIRPSPMKCRGELHKCRKWIASWTAAATPAPPNLRALSADFIDNAGVGSHRERNSRLPYRRKRISVFRTIGSAKRYSCSARDRINPFTPNRCAVALSVLEISVYSAGDGE